MSEEKINQVVKQLYTIQDVVRWAASQFSSASLCYGHGTDDPWNEAVYLVLSGLQLPADLPISLYSSRLTLNERQQLISWIYLRIEKRMPVAYITNISWFCNLSFYVDERVLIPRSPIGELIQNNFSGYLPVAPSRILDMCTGSACLAIACAYAYPQAEIDAVDISDEALAVAELNIQKHGMEQQVVPLCSDLFLNLPLDNYDIIIANPPYVDEEDISNLPLEYRHEPLLGLEAGSDGLKLICRILKDSLTYLKETGILVVEVGQSMSALKKYYPCIDFTWLPLKNGGHGVFMLNYEQLALNMKYIENNTN